MKNTLTHQPLHVAVFVDDWNGNNIREYTVDWNDPKQRAVFAEQADNAIRNHEIVTTCLEN